MVDQDVRLLDVLESCIDEDHTISLRGVCQHVGIDPGNTKRDQWRDAVIQACKMHQSELRHWRKRQAKRSRADDAKALAARDERIADLERQNALLCASHKAMILAVGELGGMAAYMRFFEDWQSVEAELARIGAMPDAEIRTLHDGSAKEHEEDVTD
jgi:hypothetical protein